MIDCVYKNTVMWFNLHITRNNPCLNIGILATTRKKTIKFKLCVSLPFGFTPSFNISTPFRR